ncbi:MAG: arginyltransferase [Polyangiaceae bacterium]|nr:arginyltransferase [Polyangiaceae bacterium]MCW5789202.1 arginyltransferase [Polyangiaceae bacterium]
MVVYDQPSRCPYLPNKLARMPMRLPTRSLRRAEFNQRLEEGDRRQGLLLYRPSCPSCHACIPLRISLAEYQLTRGQRRVQRRGERELRVELGPLMADERRVELYNTHKSQRGLETHGPSTEDDYREFLVHTCAESFEIRTYHQEHLVGVAITDRGTDALSAVYTYFDPAFSRYSLGVYSILTQLALCERWHLDYLYLGLYVSGCAAMRYKATYLPHERLLEGRWVRVERPE